MSTHVQIALYADERALLEAIRLCRAEGLEVVDAHTPYPVHGIESALGLRHTRLPVVCFLFGLTGLVAGLWLQYWTSAVDWPLNVGGKPFDSLPAFMPVAFELMVLFAGLGVAGSFLFRSRLFPGRTAVVVDPRVTDDRFALVVQAPGAAVPPQRIEEIWRRTGALEFRDEWRDDP